MRLIECVDADLVAREFLAADLEAADLDPGRTDLRLNIATRLGSSKLDLSIEAATTATTEGRAELLKVLKYCHGATLGDFAFEGAAWWKAHLEDGDELLLMRYFEGVTNTLQPLDARSYFEQERSLNDVLSLVRAGRALRPMICLARDATSPAVVLDGNQRAVVHAVAGTLRPLPIYIGLSQAVTKWPHFPSTLA